MVHSRVRTRSRRGSPDGFTALSRRRTEPNSSGRFVPSKGALRGEGTSGGPECPVFRRLAVRNNLKISCRFARLLTKNQSMRISARVSGSRVLTRNCVSVKARVFPTQHAGPEKPLTPLNHANENKQNRLHPVWDCGSWRQWLRQPVRAQHRWHGVHDRGSVQSQDRPPPFLLNDRPLSLRALAQDLKEPALAGPSSDVDRTTAYFGSCKQIWNPFCFNAPLAVPQPNVQSAL